MSASLQCKSIPDSTNVKDRMQILLNNFVLAATIAKNPYLCLRVLSSFFYWQPTLTLGGVEEYLEQYNIPILLIADTTQKWDSTCVACVSMTDCCTPFPYVIKLVIAPRHRKHHLYKSTPLDLARPHWIRTEELNRLYLEKSGILIDKKRV